MNAIILVGGQGIRLRPFTLQTPKPVLPLGNRPFIESLFVRLAEAGIRQVVLSAGYQIPALRRCLLKTKRFGMKIKVATENSPLGTGGAIRYAWPDVNESCLVFNGDILSNLNLSGLIAAHRRLRPLASLWTIPVKDPSRFGVIESSRQGKISRFIEKPKAGSTKSKSINAGVYLMESEVLHWIPKVGPSSVERDVFPAMLADGADLSAWQSAKKIYWRDVGTPQSYLMAHEDILAGRLRVGNLWAHKNKGKIIGHRVKISSAARVVKSCLGADCRVAAGASIKNSILGEGCQVGPGAQIEGAILGQGVRVGESAVLSPGSLLGKGALVPSFSKV